LTYIDVANNTHNHHICIFNKIGLFVNNYVTYWKFGLNGDEVIEVGEQLEEYVEVTDVL
jgi:hypothetical protein